MDITVGICTWNRADLLAETLARLEGLVIPQGLRWELIVVNNRCTDHTDKVLRRFRKRLPIRRIYEARPGLSHARNCVIQNAKGNLIMWTDDDVLVGSRWMKCIYEASLQQPDAQFFGGPIRSWFEGTPPTWIREIVPKYGGAFALRDIGGCAVIKQESQLPYGANFAVRANVQRRFPYDPQLGRNGLGLLGGEEISVLKAILDSGGFGYWVPQAEVRHFIPRLRQTERYLFRYFAGQGQVDLMLQGVLNCPRLLGRPRWLWRRCAVSFLHYCRSRLVSPPTVWCDHLEEFGRSFGALQVASKQ